MKKFILKQIKDIKTYGVKEFLRKLFLSLKLLLLIPMDIIAIFPCIIIRLISPWFIIRIERMPVASFGDFAIYSAFYYCKKEMKIDQPKKMYLDLLYVHYDDKIFNKQLLKMWKRKSIVLPAFILNPINRVNKLFPGWKKYRIECLSTKEDDIDNIVEKCLPLQFTAEEEIYGKSILKKFGLNQDDKFVCLAVRDDAYQKKKIPSRFRDWSYHDYRNYNIDHFVLAAEELAKKGYYVFRMGVVVNKSLNSKNSKIIDYANSDLRSDFMDVYLGAKCTFCISTGLGFDFVPHIFKRPIALFALPVASLRTHSERYLLLTKHHFLKKEKRKLSLSEIFSHGVAFAQDANIFKNKGIELIDFTPEQIRDHVLEMAENLESLKKLTTEEEELQKSFQELFISSFEKYVEVPDNKYLFSKIYPKYQKMHRQIKSRFSTKFLKENRDWLK
tara:strand:+ start:32 stop:1363 length:1332 start_codon:yes stop_codon:yes gene_type:complete